jgi:hypothetical protein
LRHHFRAWRGTTPQAYRHAFCPAEISGRPDVPDAALERGPVAPDRSYSSAAYSPSRSLIGASPA